MSLDNSTDVGWRRFWPVRHKLTQFPIDAFCHRQVIVNSGRRAPRLRLGNSAMTSGSGSNPVGASLSCRPSFIPKVDRSGDTVSICLPSHCRLMDTSTPQPTRMDCGHFSLVSSLAVAPSERWLMLEPVGEQFSSFFEHRDRRPPGAR